MGFLFRVEQITVAEGNTVLMGHMISGAVNWQQQVEIQVAEDMKTVFAAPLRGVASTEDTGLALFDPASWENVLALPQSFSRGKRIGLILDGAAPLSDLRVPAIAVGVDVPTGMAAERIQTAFQSADPPILGAGNVGVPVREYPYRISRRGILHFAPWSLFCLTVVLSSVYLAGIFNGLPLQGLKLERLFACILFGFFDVLFLCLSVKMLLARPSQIVVTTTGMIVPVIAPGFSSHKVYVPFAAMDDMLEYWHDGAVHFLKLKTARGAIHLNVYLMQPAHFEDTRRLLWRRIHGNRLRQEPFLPTALMQ